MRGEALLVVSAALAAAALRLADRDFEFDDGALQEVQEDEDIPVTANRHRFSYDPQSGACGAARCGAGQRCERRAGRRAVCVAGHAVSENDVLLQEQSLRDDDDTPAPVRSAGAVCGRDNRTYPSLCAMDARNCGPVRPPVRPRCHRACPCPHHHHHDQIHNEVITDRGSHRRQPDDGAGCSLAPLAERLLAWFSALQRDAPAPPPRGFPADCKPEVRWMFAHLDTDRDGLLSDDNLYALKHDDRERCLRPLLRSCGRRGGAGAAGGAGAGAAGGAGAGGLTRRQWCACLRGAARPCAAMAARRRRGWRPACDARGFFLPRQCAARRCWCVDPRGAARPARDGACPPAGQVAEENAGEGEDEGVGAGEGEGEDADDSEDDDDAGSGDAPLAP